MGIREFNRVVSGIPGEKRVFAVDRDFSEADAVRLPVRRSDLNKNPFVLKIFHINDLHSNIYSFNDDYSTSPVFSRIVNAVEEENISTKNNTNMGTLFLSAGDDSTGSPLDHLTGYDGENFICHPAYSAYRLGGIDATVLGNHDFDTGIETLKKSIQQDTDFPVLSANLNHTGELDNLVFPGAIVIIKGVRIGIIGLTTPGHIRSREGSAFSIENPLDSVNKLYNKLENVCDSVIILSHLGYKLGSYFAAVKVMGDLELASELKKCKIDLIVGGHTHDFLNINGMVPDNIINNIPIVQAGYNGLFYGLSLLKVSKQNCLIRTSIIPTGQKADSRKFDLAYLNIPAGKSIPELRKTIGRLDIPEDYNITLFENSKDSFENPMANFITDALASEIRDKELVIDFALIDGASMIKFFNPKRKFVNVIDIYKLMPYADTLVIASISGTILNDLIHGNAQRLNKDDYPNIDRGFIHFSRELRYVIDKKCNDISSIYINEISLENCYDKEFTFVMPNFVQGLSGKWEETEAALGNKIPNLRDTNKTDTGLYARNELLNYIEKNDVTVDSGFLLNGRLKII